MYRAIRVSSSCQGKGDIPVNRGYIPRGVIPRAVDLVLLAALLPAAGCGADGSTPTIPAPVPPPPPPPPEDLVVAPAEAGKVAGDRIKLTLTSEAGAPLPDTPYEWTTDEHSGWVFPAEGRTDDEGAIDAAWIPGFPGVGELTLEFVEGGEEKTLEFQTFSVAPPHPPNSALNAAFSTPLATGYAIDMTPLAEPVGTFYTALHWDGGYAGLQRTGNRFDRQLQFSVWDRPAGDASVVEAGEGVDCRDFGNEGTGVACEAEHPWAVGETFRFVVTEEVEQGASVMSLTVTDVETGEQRYIGTLKYGRKADMTRFGVFVEDFNRSRPTCLDQPVRSAAFRRAMARTTTGWVPLPTIRLEPHREDASNPGTPACANFDARPHPAGLEIVMGGTNVRDPHAGRVLTVPE